MIHWIFVLSFLLACGLLCYYCYRLNTAYRHLKHQKKLEGHLLNHMSCHWCYWRWGEELIHCSPNLAAVLGFDSQDPLLLKELLKILSDSAFSPFQKALFHLSQFGGTFQLSLSLLEQSLFLEIHGRSFHDNPNSDSLSAVKDRPIILLNFIDVTEKMSETLQFQNQDKAKDQDIIILTDIINSAPLALWYRDSNGSLRYCNKHYATWLESSIPKVLAENKELIEGKGEQSSYAIAKRALLTKTEQTLAVHKVIEGQRRLLKIGEIPLETGANVGYGLDFTFVETIENESRKNIEAYREVLHHIPVPIAMYNDKTELSFFNQSFVCLFNFDEKWLYTCPPYGEVLENLRERRKLPEYSNFLDYKHKNLAFFKNLMQPTHELLHLPDGQILRSVITPHPLGGLIFLFDDITDKLSLERGYNTLLQVQKKTLDHLYEGLIVFGTDNRLQLSNPAMERIWNLTPEQREIGQHINEVLQNVAPVFKDPQDVRLWRRQMMSQISSRNRMEGSFSLKEGRQVDYCYVPLPDGANLLIFIDGSNRWRFKKDSSQLF